MFFDQVADYGKLRVPPWRCSKQVQLRHIAQAGPLRLAESLNQACVTKYRNKNRMEFAHLALGALLQSDPDVIEARALRLIAYSMDFLGVISDPTDLQSKYSIGAKKFYSRVLDVGMRVGRFRGECPPDEFIDVLTATSYVLPHVALSAGFEHGGVDAEAISSRSSIPHHEVQDMGFSFRGKTKMIPDVVEPTMIELPLADPSKRLLLDSEAGQEADQAIVSTNNSELTTQSQESLPPLVTSAKIDFVYLDRLAKYAIWLCRCEGSSAVPAPLFLALLEAYHRMEMGLRQGREFVGGASSSSDFDGSVDGASADAGVIAGRYSRWTKTSHRRRKGAVEYPAIDVICEQIAKCGRLPDINKAAIMLTDMNVDLRALASLFESEFSAANKKKPRKMFKAANATDARQLLTVIQEHALETPRGCAPKSTRHSLLKLCSAHKTDVPETELTKAREVEMTLDMRRKGAASLTRARNVGKPVSKFGHLPGHVKEENHKMRTIPYKKIVWQVPE